MVNKVYCKTIAKTIKSKFVRFLVNMLIVTLSIAIASALGMLPLSFRDSYLKNFTNYQVTKELINLLNHQRK